MMTAQELQEKFTGFSHNYFLIDVYHDRESYYAVKEEDYYKYPLTISGVFLNLVMDGELEKAWDLINKISDNFPIPLMAKGFTLVHPKVTWKQFIDIIEYLKKIKQPLCSVILTAGRPSILNGMNDFSRIGPFLERYKQLFIEDLKMLYEGECVQPIYKLCLAEYKYQQNNILEAEMLVSSTIKELDRNSERRLLFTALYLQSKIMLTSAKNVSAGSFIKQINNYVKENGKAEFSYNIEAAHVLFSIIEGNTSLPVKWLSNGAPNEFSDFNMLDLYRYMVKMRCYIISRNYSAVIALAERLRPLLEAGRRFMDLCELHIILTIAFYKAGRKDCAFSSLEKALKIAKRRNYLRLVADEGEAIMHPLIDYVNLKGSSPFLMNLIEITRSMAIARPLYLKTQAEGEKAFSQMEIDILHLLEQGKEKEEIGEYFFISVNTVKYHLKKIYTKLGVNTALQAVWEGRVLGIL